MIATIDVDLCAARISKSDDPNTAPTTERQILITGNADSVALAKSLINMSLDLHKVNLRDCLVGLFRFLINQVM